MQKGANGRLGNLKQGCLGPGVEDYGIIARSESDNIQWGGVGWVGGQGLGQVTESIKRGWDFTF